MKMPYVVGPPVRLPTDFFGRAGQTRQFYESLIGAQTQSVSVLGLRRAGKTSFLQYVSHPEIMVSFVPDPQRYMMIYVDVSACKTQGELYNRVYRKLLAGLPRVPAGVERSASASDVYDVESLLYEYGNRRVVILLDEFDQLRTAGFSADFMSELRALAGIWDYELAYVTASYWDNYRLGNFVGLPPTSPFYNIFYPSPIYLSGLSPSELEDLVKVPARRVGIVADEEDVAFVRYYAGTLPFFVQAVAATWLTFKSQGQLPAANEITRRLVPEMWPYYEQWWLNFNDVERDVMTAVVHEKPVERLPFSEPDIAQAVHRLTHYGVITSTGAQHWCDGALFGYWLQEYMGRGKTNPSGAALAARTGDVRATSKAIPLGSGEVTRFLQVCIAVGRQFERLPIVYARKSDTELRDQLALALQSGFVTNSEGVIVAPLGNNELVVRSGGTNAIVALCTTWMGQKGLLRNVDGLLGQLTAPDANAAVIVFVRDREFGLVADAIAQVMPHHPTYMSFVGRSENQLDFRFHLNGDPHREISLSVLLFHLPG